ncbi:hypothetical protein Vadar_024921 [Vaccinium darrowii]|uniref:Uncharacterized protein n=1 Tax=Vaccinium darrowii TaxID=229202 RepID=A0ACB7YH13_9ERIC|nr:hypothetical protein Vadar_024921 [Vaccinium darrowii]
MIREVWAENLEDELSLIEQVLADYPYVAMDTEFPGTIFHPVIEKHQLSRLSPDKNYYVMKANVDALKLIQLGLTLSDSDGNLPGTHYSYVWQFNFRDFDIDVDPYYEDSINLLKKQGINFQKNRKYGIDSVKFGSLLLNSRIFPCFPSMVTWITFHSAYDFGFLLKILTQRKLAEDLCMFMRLVSTYFGGAVYDIKHMMQNCPGLYGGLERVAKTLEVDRVVGNNHQAGSDTLLILQTFMKLRDLYFGGKAGKLIFEFQSAFESINDKRMDLVCQKLTEAKRLSTDGKLCQSKQLHDAMEVLSTNKDFFLKFLQEPNSLFSQHLFADFQSVPPPPETKRITVLRPSKVVDNKKLSGSGKKDEKQIKRATHGLHTCVSFILDYCLPYY